MEMVKPGAQACEIGHLSQVGTFAAQQLTHLAVAFGEKVHKLFLPFPSFLSMCGAAARHRPVPLGNAAEIPVRGGACSDGTTGLSGDRLKYRANIIPI